MHNFGLSICIKKVEVSLRTMLKRSNGIASLPIRVMPLLKTISAALRMAKVIIGPNFGFTF